MTKSTKRKAHDKARDERKATEVETRSQYLPPPYTPVVTDRVERVFPAHVRHLMPDPATIAGHESRHQYLDLFNAWFFGGLTKIEPTPREGVDVDTALWHIRTLLGSYEPKHEHKEAAVCFLLDTWFLSVKWEARDE